MKQCTKCRQAKPFNQFHVQKRHSTGRQSWCKTCCLESKRANYQKRGDELRAYRRARYADIKQQAINTYGGRCACCGVAEPVWLNIDHENGDGATHRKTLPSNGRAGAIYAWLKRMGYPSGFRVLCFNCNVAEHLGGCPHRSWAN